MCELVNLEDVNFSYRKKKIYENLNLSIKKGDILAVLGHNGAGKTTLIKIIAGLVNIQRGKIERNIDYSDIGLMNEELGLYPFLSAKENLDLITLRHNCNYTSSELETFISNYKLDKTMNVSKFSTGMKKKLSFLGTLLHKPRLFFILTNLMI